MQMPSRKRKKTVMARKIARVSSSYAKMVAKLLKKNAGAKRAKRRKKTRK